MTQLARQTWLGFLRSNMFLLPLAEVHAGRVRMRRMLRLSLLQITVGMALVLLTGTLNRVMILELGVAAHVVAVMVALPVLFAPARLLVGFRSDHHRSVLGWRRVPYIWFGSLAQFGGFAIMPFALLILSGDTSGPLWVGDVSAALAFLLVGAGLHTTQTAGLALANDIVAEEDRPRVVAILYVMLLLGMLVSALLFGYLLRDFTQVKLIQVVQAAAVITVVANLVALWKQETFRRQTPDEASADARPDFLSTWRVFSAKLRMQRFLLAVGLGSMGFAMQDILLEPYGGEILNLSVGATTALTALYAAGALVAFMFAGERLSRGGNPYRLCANGALIGILGFSLVVFAAPLSSVICFRMGTFLIGLGGGLFCVGTLISAMAFGAQDSTAKGALTDASGHPDCSASSATSMNGFALGAWGAVHATAVGIGVAAGGTLRDLVSGYAVRGGLGAGFEDPVLGYTVVYHIEILLLFAMLVVLGPLVNMSPQKSAPALPNGRFGLSDFPSL